MDNLEHKVSHLITSSCLVVVAIFSVWPNDFWQTFIIKLEICGALYVKTDLSPTVFSYCFKYLIAWCALIEPQLSHSFLTLTS